MASVGASGLGQALVDLFLARRNRPDEGLHDSVVLVIVVVHHILNSSHPNIFHSQPCRQVKVQS